MKKTIIILLAAILCPQFVKAQAEQINEILDKYEKLKSVESIIIDPSLMDLVNPDENNETKEVVSKIKKIRILSVPTTAIEKGVPVRSILQKELEHLIQKEQFSRVVKINNADEQVEFFISKNGEDALLVLSGCPEMFTVISFFGKIDKSVVNSVMNGNIKFKKSKSSGN